MFLIAMPRSSTVDELGANKLLVTKGCSLDHTVTAKSCNIAQLSSSMTYRSAVQWLPFLCTRFSSKLVFNPALHSAFHRFLRLSPSGADTKVFVVGDLLSLHKLLWRMQQAFLYSAKLSPYAWEKAVLAFLNYSTQITQTYEITLTSNLQVDKWLRLLEQL